VNRQQTQERKEAAMFPIGDDNIRGGPPPIVNWALIVLNALVFIYESSLSQTELASFFNQYAVIPTQVLAGQNVTSLLTSMFLHGGWLHVGGNMLFLWVFGDNIEKTLGHLGYLLFYLAGGLVASGAHVLLNASSNIPSLGASGAIAAVMGAYILMFPHSRVRVFVLFGFFARVTQVAAILFLGIWFVMQLFNGVASLGVPTAQSAGVAFWAHIGGFVAGLPVGLLNREKAARLLPRYNRW
jgi:membrane associated rhomboid family serine protease